VRTEDGPGDRDVGSRLIRTDVRLALRSSATADRIGPPGLARSIRALGRATDLLLVWLLAGTTWRAHETREGAGSPAPFGHGWRYYWTVMLPCIHGWKTHR
jgi:hypothetical protein